MGRVSILVLLVGIFAVSCSARCIGFDNGDLGLACKKITSKSACLAAYSQEEEYIKTSCRWRTMDAEHVYETSYTWTRYTGFYNEVKFSGSIAGVVAKVTLPEDSKGRYGAANNFYTGSFKSPRPYSYHIAPCGLDKKSLTATVQWVPPKGYATTPWYKTNVQDVYFNIADQKMIDQLKKNASNPVLDDFVKVKMDYRFFKSPPPPKPTAIVKSESFLGVNVNYTGSYQVGSYRAYTITNVTGVDFKVAVEYQLKGPAFNDPNAKPVSATKAKLTSFIIKASEMDKWEKECTKTCPPPTSLAAKYSTVCNGYSCKGKARKMNPNVEYLMFVSTPEVWSYAYSGELSQAGKPINFPYPTQRIKIDVKQNKYSLAPLEPAGARDAEIFDDNVFLVGPPARPEHSFQQN